MQRSQGEGPLVEERYAVDPSGVVEVTIRDLETGFERHHRFSAVGM